MINFIKYQGCGNDYIYIDCFNQEISWPDKLSKTMSNRNFGVGSDGIILIFPSKVADARIQIFNSDGSEAKMCGNGVRCVAKYLYDEKKILKKELKIETISGIKNLKILKSEKQTSLIETDMSAPNFEYDKIPFDLNEYLKDHNENPNFFNKIIDKPLKINDKIYKVTVLSMGNPHVIIFVDNLYNFDFKNEAKEIQNSKYFIESVNVSFVKINKKTKNSLSMRVYERGSGETMACGTGACAAAVASVVNRIFNMNELIKIKLKGGILFVKYTGYTVYLTGNATKVFKGRY